MQAAVDKHNRNPWCFPGRSLRAGRLLKWGSTPVFLPAACERPVRLSCELEEVDAERPETRRTSETEVMKYGTLCWA